ncbi:aldehyde dehydrogenase family protein, partial [Bacillus thuringiensis]
TIADEFIRVLINKIKKLKLGNGSSHNYDIGPLINNKAITKVKQHLEDAMSKGANIIYRGNGSQGKGYFFEPILIGNVNSEMKIVSEETFGPLLPIFTFNDSDNNIV